MGFNCLTKLSVTSQTLWPPPAEDLCCLMLRRRHTVYVYIFIFYGTEQFLHMRAEPLGWIGTEFGIISIIHTTPARRYCSRRKMVLKIQKIIDPV